MRDVVTIDLRALMEKRLTEPGKQGSGHRLTLTNEQEWYLWTLKDHCTQRQLSEDLKICRDKVTENKRRLEEQGGPKGERPAWVK